MSSDQLPQSKAHAAKEHLLASLRRDRRKSSASVSVMLKLPADLAAWVSEAAGREGFDNRQGFIVNTLRQRKGRENAA